MAKKKPGKKRPMQIWKLYEIKDGKVIRKNPFSQKAGPGCFMANHKDRWVCGKSGYVEKKDKKE